MSPNLKLGQLRRRNHLPTRGLTAGIDLAFSTSVMMMNEDLQELDRRLKERICPAVSPRVGMDGSAAAVDPA